MHCLRLFKNCCVGLVALAATVGCGPFDFGVEWRHGHYALIWVDDPEDVRLSYDMGEGSWLGKVESRVFAVGADDRYIVAKQHPGGDKAVTNYFIVDIQADQPRHEGVSGPMTAEAFAARAQDLRLPTFTKTLKSLQ